MIIQIVFCVLTAIFVILQAADIYSTYVVIEDCEGQELNKIAKFFIDKFGVVLGLSIIKLSTSIFVVGLLYFTTFTLNLAIYSLIAMVIIIFGYIWVVYHNYNEAKKYKNRTGK